MTEALILIFLVIVTVFLAIPIYVFFGLSLVAFLLVATLVFSLIFGVAIVVLALKRGGG